MGRKVRIDMGGRRYGRLVAIEAAHRDASGHLHWRFACDCGAQTVAHGGNVRAGRTTSCGCFHRETSAARLMTHGARAAGRHGPTYRAWQRMNDACANSASPGFARTGARGVRVAARWIADYGAFLADLGQRPVGTMLARIDPSLGFAPGNCRWAPLADRATRAAVGWQARRLAVAAQANAAPPGPLPTLSPFVLSLSKHLSRATHPSTDSGRTGDVGRDRV